MTPKRDGEARGNPREPYYVLYFTERSASGFMGPLKRARYASARDAVDRAYSMRQCPQLNPIEVRDQQDKLITCALMGWRLPSLHPAAQTGTGTRPQRVEADLSDRR